MQIILKKILLGCFLLLVAGSQLFGQVKFSASISPSQINKDEYATYRLLIENTADIRKLSPPSFKDFVVVGGPNQESGMTNINGTVSQYIAISYILQPRKTGTISLDAAKANIAGKQLSATPAKLLVKKANGNSGSRNAAPNPFAGVNPFAMPRPREDFSDFVLEKGENIQEKVEKNMQLRLETSKNGCFVGEPIIANYKLYSRLKSESKLTGNPSFNGFSVIDLQEPDATDYSREKLNGREFNVYSIRKAQLYPLQPGNIVLEAATLENRLQFIKAEAPALQEHISGFLNGFGMNPDALITQTVSLSSKPITITVKPLPTEGKPASFKGAVGKFNLVVQLDNDRFSTDETGKLVISITGGGNLQLVTAPDISWPTNLDAFDQNVTEELNERTVPVSGRKTFEIPFSVGAAGAYDIPAVEFSYFDPATASYKILRSKPMHIEVSKGMRKPLSVTNAVEEDKSTGIAKLLFKYRGWMVLAIFVLLLLAVLFSFTIEKRKKKKLAKDEPMVMPAVQQDPVVMKAVAVPQNPLSETEDCLNSTDCTDFYIILSKEFKQFFAVRFGMLPPEINAKSIDDLLDKVGIENGMAIRIQQLMQALEWELYTPFERNDRIQESYREAQSIIQELNTPSAATR